MIFISCGNKEIPVQIPAMIPINCVLSGILHLQVCQIIMSFDLITHGTHQARGALFICAPFAIVKGEVAKRGLVQYHMK